MRKFQFSDRKKIVQNFNHFIGPGSKHHRRKTVGIVQRRGLARFRRAAKIVIIMLRAGGVLNTHKHEYVDPGIFDLIQTIYLILSR